MGSKLASFDTSGAQLDDDLREFLYNHIVESKKSGGSSPDKPQTHTWHGTRTFLLHIPENETDYFWEMYCRHPRRHRPPISEKIPNPSDPKEKEDVTFKLFADIDWKLIDLISRGFDTKQSAEEATSYFDRLIKNFIEHANKVIREIEMETAAETDSQDDPVDLEHIALSRAAYKWHIHWPNIIINRRTAKTFVRKMLARLPQHPLFEWSKVFDDSPYGKQLRVAGCRKGCFAKAMDFHREDEAHQGIWDNDDGRSGVYELNGEFNIDILHRCLIRVPDGTKPNLVSLYNKKVSSEERQEYVENMFTTGRDIIIRRKIQRALQLLTATYPDIAEIKTGIMGLKCINPAPRYVYIVELESQSCPFIGKMHRRTLEKNQPAIYVELVRTQATLKCWKCQTTNKEQRCITLPIGSDDLDEVELMEMAEYSFNMQTDQSIMDFCFQFLKNRMACSPSSALGSRPPQWYYFAPEHHRWIPDNFQVVADIMEPDGIIQSRYNAVKDNLLSQSADADHRSQVKRQHKELVRKLQSKKIQGAVIPLLAAKIADYWRDKDSLDYFEERLNKDRTKRVFLNGVYDFKECKFRPGRPEDLLSKSMLNPYVPWKATLNQTYPMTAIKDENGQYIPLQLDENSRRETQDYIDEIMPLEDEAEYFLWVLSQTLNADERQQKIYFLLGGGGDGKSLFMFILRKAFGDYFRGGPPSMICGAGQTNSAGARSDLMFTKDCIILEISEPNRGDSLNPGEFKKIVGGTDVLYCRENYGQQTFLEVTGTIFMPLNYHININADIKDEGTYRRLAYLLFRRKYRPSQAHFTSFETHPYQSIAQSIEELKPMVNRLKVSLMSLIIHYYEKYKGLGVLPAPDALTREVQKDMEMNDFWFKFLNDKTEEPPCDTKGKTKSDDIDSYFLSIHDLWQGWKGWSKAESSNLRNIRIETFIENLIQKLGPAIRRPGARCKQIAGNVTGEGVIQPKSKNKQKVYSNFDMGWRLRWKNEHPDNIDTQGVNKEVNDIITPEFLQTQNAVHTYEKSLKTWFDNDK